MSAIISDAVFPLSVVSLAVAAVATLPGAFGIIAQTRNRTPRDNFYEDKDGKATPESMAAFSNRRPKAFIIGLAIVGLGTSIAVSALSMSDSHSDNPNLVNWLITAAWAAIVSQAIFIHAHHSPVKSYELGQLTALSSIWTGFAVLLQLFDVIRNSSPLEHHYRSFRTVNAVTLLLLYIAALSLPRRPEVFYKGQQVNREMTCTALSRFTWSWDGPMIKLAAKKGDLDKTDIPTTGYETRVSTLISAWTRANHQGGLLKSLIRAYGTRFLFQWFAILLQCVWGIVPFWTMQRLVETLEKRDLGETGQSETLLVLAILLGVVGFAEQWLAGTVMWYSINKLYLPFRGQLSALVFEKSLRRKNVKSADKAKEEPAPEDSAKKDDKKTEDDDDDEGSDSVLKSRQAIVNLVGVDAKHVAEFALMQTYMVSCAGQLVVLSGYLINLIGIIPFGAGIFAWALVLPINTVASKYYIKTLNKLMKNRDEKLAVVSEALTSMRQIKFSALETQWEKRILSQREIEISTLKRLFTADVFILTCWIASPILLAAVALAVYAIRNGELSPSVAFVSIGIFKTLEGALSALPEMLTALFDTLVSVRRLDTYLEGPEIQQTVNEGYDVAFDNATIAWPVDTEVPEEDRFILRNLNLSFPAGELSVISGKTGSGKSLLLNALLGEADLLDGAILAPAVATSSANEDAKAHPGNWIVPGSVAYVGQTPWLESSSFRDNILFGLPYIESRYNEVIHVCALAKDIEILVDGDKTELGANGVNLSGGQKWRVTLARSIYSRAEILIMDDIFSAVDAHVGRHIFEKCITGEICKDRTRILVTHHVQLVEKKAKYLVELGEGTVLNAGLLSELEDNGTLELIKSHEQPLIGRASLGESSQAPTAINSEQASVNTADAEQESSTATQVEEDNSLRKVRSNAEAKKFVEEEAREKGRVKGFVYSTIISNGGGWPLWSVLFFIFFAFQASNLSRGWWVSVWTGDSHQGVNASTISTQSTSYGSPLGSSFFYATKNALLSASDTFDSASTQHHGLAFYLWIYVALCGIGAMLGTVRYIWSFMISIRNSRKLFQDILHTVMRTPLRWLDTVPVGRILNRMTADFDVIDNRIIVNLGFTSGRVLDLVGICIAAVFVSFAVVPLATVLLAIVVLIAIRFLAAARPVKRLESTAKSPVFEIFNTALAGVSTLRAYRKTGVYVERMYTNLDSWDTISIHNWSLNRWLGLRMTIIGSIFTATVSIITVKSSLINASLAGFTLSFALSFSDNVLKAVRGYAQMELDMNAAERVIEYTTIETENLGGEEPPASWPTSSSINVEDLVVAYAPDLPPVLNGISFDVKNNERIGVVGRTGAGKSSLTLALFRFLEARRGRVVIDGIDISKMTLQSLRSRLAIIPQDPVLFSGTVRDNLDPFSKHTDAELYDCLSRVHLIDSTPSTPTTESLATGSTAIAKNINIFRDLSSPISESGGNLSQGQRQLMCLARAIISKPKIMVLDEATSAVDMNTDTLIQRSIREEFNDNALIVIAHRLSTVADFDRILVLSEGAVAEFGTPRELWENEDGIFRDMCEHSGEKSQLKAVILKEDE